MQRVSLQALLWLLSLCSVAGAVSLALTARDSSLRLFALGTVELSPGGTAFVPAATVLAPGRYCVGTKDLPGHECFTYTHLEGGIGQKTVQVTVEDGKVLQLALANGSPDTPVKIVTPAVAPTPNLDPVPLQVKKKKPKVVENTEDQQVTKSWIQENWMYIVPPLVILMMLLPAEEEKK